MTETTRALSKMLQHKRIGLIASGAMEATLSGLLLQAEASFTQIDAKVFGPESRELDRYHALILHVGDDAVESDWYRPELLRTNSRPLLLASEAEAVYCRISLQDHVDDVIFAPFLPDELLFRLSRLTVGMHTGRHAAPRSVRPCVLVADDDRGIIVYLKTVLKNFDVDAHFVSDGREALAAARKLLPDLLLLDVGMPVMSGLDVLRSLRNDPGTRGLVTVLLTASADPLHVEEGADLGAVDYILKPFGHISLIRKLKALLRDCFGDRRFAPAQISIAQ